MNYVTLPKTVVLVGLMGCGKTAIGKRLAVQLDVPFFDLDHEIEALLGYSVSEIFEKYGEPHFRQAEQEVIIRLIEGKPCILASGGGAFIQDAIRKLIKKKAISVWLKADFEVLLERVSRKNNRPLLEQGNKAEILKRLMKERYPVYAEADITVDSGEGPHNMVVERVIHTLKGFLEQVKA